jgi:uncharacterized protein (TIGR03083 family)
MNGDDVLDAVEACREVLEPHRDSDWSVAVPDLDFTVASVLAHATQGQIWYSLDIWSGPTDSTAFEVGLRQDASNAALLASLHSAASTCAAAIDAAPPATRGFHPFGSPDPDGFAAIACDELLIHGDDAARGLGDRLTPPAGLAARVLARIFPWHQDDGDPWQTLLWANGRAELPERPHQARWRWHCAPLSEWDGGSPPTSGGSQSAG